MPFITGTQTAYYFTCKRKLWLFANGINMEHTSDIVSDGKLVHENSYTDRAEKYTEISIGGIKVDFFDTKNKIIHETKRSNSIEAAHEWQLKYYIYVFKQNGIDGVTGILEYPRLRIRNEVLMTDADEIYIKNILPDIQGIIEQENCPTVAKMKICKSCSYNDLCWVSEE